MKTSISFSSLGVNGIQQGAQDRPHSLDVLDAAYHTAHSFPGGVPALAQRMGVASGTLAKKVGINVDTHHLNLREAVTMQEVTGDASILQAMAEALGYTCIRTIPAASDDPLALHWQMASQLADMHHAVADAFAQGVTPNSLRRCNNMASEAVSAINNLLGALRAQLPTPPGGQK